MSIPLVAVLDMGFSFLRLILAADAFLRRDTILEGTIVGSCMYVHRLILYTT
jgi:hypothetical protein